MAEIHDNNKHISVQETKTIDDNNCKEKNSLV